MYLGPRLLQPRWPLGTLADIWNAIMANFTVTHIVDGDTFDVSPNWQWNGRSGSRVRPAGYDAPEIGVPFSAVATDRLRRLIGGKTVELRNGHTIDRERLVCEVYVGGRNLASYFPAYRA